MNSQLFGFASLHDQGQFQRLPFDDALTFGHEDEQERAEEPSALSLLAKSRKKESNKEAKIDLLRQFSTHIGALQARCAGNEDAKAELEMLKQSSDALTSDSSSNGAALAELLDKINTALQSLHTPFDPTEPAQEAATTVVNKIKALFAFFEAKASTSGSASASSSTSSSRGVTSQDAIKDELLKHGKQVPTNLNGIRPEDLVACPWCGDRTATLLFTREDLQRLEAAAQVAFNQRRQRAQADDAERQKKIRRKKNEQGPSNVLARLSLAVVCRFRFDLFIKREEDHAHLAQSGVRSGGRGAWWALAD